VTLSNCWGGIAPPGTWPRPPCTAPYCERLRRSRTDWRRNSLRFIRSGSAAITPDLIEALEAAFEAPVIHGYGMTEAGVITSTGSTEKGCVAKEYRRGNRDHECGRVDSAAATEGEIVLRGDAVISGYLDDRDANRTAFTEGWFRTGDLGRLNRSGELFITGRLREMINRGAKRSCRTKSIAPWLSIPRCRRRRRLPWLIDAREDVAAAGSPSRWSEH